MATGMEMQGKIRLLLLLLYVLCGGIDGCSVSHTIVSSNERIERHCHYRYVLLYSSFCLICIESLFFSPRDFNSPIQKWYSGQQFFNSQQYGIYSDSGWLLFSFTFFIIPLYFFSCNNSSIFHNLVFSVLNLNHNCQRVVGEEPDRQIMCMYYIFI